MPPHARRPAVIQIHEIGIVPVRPKLERNHAAGGIRHGVYRCCRSTSYTAMATVVDKFSDRTRSDMIGRLTNRSA